MLFSAVLRVFGACPPLSLVSGVALSRSVNLPKPPPFPHLCDGENGVALCTSQTLQRLPGVTWIVKGPSAGRPARCEVLSSYFRPGWSSEGRQPTLAAQPASPHHPVTLKMPVP